MINDLLAFWTPGLIELVVILIILGIPILLIVLFVRYLSRSSKERQKLRLELGKLADELRRTQEQLKGRKKDDSPGKSG